MVWVMFGLLLTIELGQRLRLILTPNETLTVTRNCYTAMSRCYCVRAVLPSCIDVLQVQWWIFITHGANTINVFRACLGAQLTICAQK